MEEEDIDIDTLEIEAKQLKEEAKYIEALEKLEKALVGKKHKFGANSVESTETCKDLCEICNMLAMIYLKNSEEEMALDLLRRSEILCENNDQGKAITYNNIACYYRRIGKLRVALGYLEKALMLEKHISTVETPADTHLNICAVLSQLGKHEGALQHAMAAVIMLQEQMLLNIGVKSPKDPMDKNTDNKDDKRSVLAIAYHNMGVEQEFLQRYDTALVSYRKSVTFAEKHLGVEDTITKNLSNVYENAKLELLQIKNKGKGKGRKKQVEEEKPQGEELSRMTPRESIGEGALEDVESERANKRTGNSKRDKEPTPPKKQDEEDEDDDEVEDEI